MEAYMFCKLDLNLSSWEKKKGLMASFKHVLFVVNMRKNRWEISNSSSQVIKQVFNMFFRHPGRVNWLKAAEKKPLKPYPVGYSAVPDRWSSYGRRESPSLEGRINNLRGLSGMSIHLSKWL